MAGLDTGGGSLSNQSSSANGDFMGGRAGGGNSYNFGPPPNRLGTAQISNSAIMMIVGVAMVAVLLMKKKG